MNNTMTSLVKSIARRKVRPLSPGDIILDLLKDRGIDFDQYCGSNSQLKEALFGRTDPIGLGERPMSYLFAEQLENQLGIKAQLLLDLQRRVDIWDSLEK